MKTHYHFSAPGRTEIGGNHTDHQHGRVLAAAVDLAIEAEVFLNETDRIRVRSEGYPTFEVDLNDLSVHPEEQGSSAALVRGVAAAFAQRGAKLQGFDMTVRSEVLPGSGLSSSAAFEVLVGTILNELFYDSTLTPGQVAQVGQYAENIYFGKPCGLMDQTVCAIGGLVSIDFCDPDHPVVEQVDFDFRGAGIALCIIDSGADHADLTEEYAAITRELKQLCAFFGKDYLRQIPEADFMAALPRLRNAVSDRAILRAMHVYRDNERVEAQVQALKTGNVDTFLRLVTQSGHSSWMYLQNVYPAGAVQKQPVAYALALCDMLLQGRGGYRIHGGGFAGTVQAFVPCDMLAGFKTAVEAALGAGSCHVLNVRPHGAGRRK